MANPLKGFEIPLLDLTDDALIDWFAVAVDSGRDWTEFRQEIKRRILAGEAPKQANQRGKGGRG